MAIKKKVLVIDDEPQVGMIFNKILRAEGYDVTSSPSGEDGIKKLSSKPDMVFLDINLPGMNGVDTLRKIREKNETVPVVMMTAFQTVDSAVETMKLGAVEYLMKPLDKDRIVAVADHALKLKAAKPFKSDAVLAPGDLVGKSPAFEATQKLIAKVAPTDLTVMLLGESGTGKELTARAIHLNSKRKDKEFVPVDCAALPESLMESELFGFEKGAFTGAEKSRAGRFEMAHEGTLFLDEIGNLSFTVQAKLLRVLQDPSFVRLGGRKQIRVNTRVVTATNKDLEVACHQGQFREDLYHRIKVFTIELSPLRNRIEDIPLLVDFYVKKYSQEMGVSQKKVSSKLIDLLSQYRWPGNIRELSNALRSAVVLSDDEITSEHLPPSIRSDNSQPAPEESHKLGDAALKDVVKKVESEHIRAVLEKTKWNKTEAAKQLGIDYKTLYNKIKDYGISEK